MSSSGGFPLDLVLFGMIAAFLVLRLRSILGRRTGFERPPESRVVPPPGPSVAARGRPAGPVVEGVAEPVAPAAGPALPDPASPAGQGLARLQRADPGFDPAHFLRGAQAAFRIIVTAFAAGRRAELQSLLAPEIYATFEAAITAREAAGQRQFTDIKAITAVSIEAVDVRGPIADITVRFVSDQVNHTEDATGQIVSGTESVTEITDLWTFEREIGAADPTWRLVAARSA
jgi:predicted lipid-binding transport protein (Tim44 family)